MKVIASASNDNKLEYMKSLGADVVFNYKKDKYEDVIPKHGPLDVYYVSQMFSTRTKCN